MEKKKAQRIQVGDWNKPISKTGPQRRKTNKTQVSQRIHQRYQKRKIQVSGGPAVSKTTTKVNNDTVSDGSSDETREVESMDEEVFQETIRNKRKFSDDISLTTPSAPKKE